MGQMCIVHIHLVVIDMKAAQTFSALGMDYYHTYASKKVGISTSLDNEAWTPQGVLETPRVGNHYFQFSLL